MNLPVKNSIMSPETISGGEQIAIQDSGMVLADKDAENRSVNAENNQAVIIFGHKKNNCKCNGDCKNCKCKGRCQN